MELSPCPNPLPLDLSIRARSSPVFAPSVPFTMPSSPCAPIDYSQKAADQFSFDRSSFSPISDVSDDESSSTSLYPPDFLQPPQCCPEISPHFMAQYDQNNYLQGPTDQEKSNQFPTNQEKSIPFPSNRDNNLQFSSNGDNNLQFPNNEEIFKFPSPVNGDNLNFPSVAGEKLKFLSIGEILNAPSKECPQGKKRRKSNSPRKNVQVDPTTSTDSGSCLPPKKDYRADPLYWEKRKKNNEAAKKSREARTAKMTQIQIRCAVLEMENMKMKIEIASMERQRSMLRETIERREMEKRLKMMGHGLALANFIPTDKM